MLEFETITKENCGQQLIKIREVAGKLSIAKLAKVLGVSRSTVQRIEDGKTLPSDEFLNRLEAVQVLGAARYQKLSEKEKTSYSDFFEKLGMSSGTDLGAIGGASISSIGVITGLNAIGVASIMPSPIQTLWYLPSIGLGILQAIKTILDANKLHCEEVDGRWEILIKTKKENNDGKGKPKRNKKSK